MPMLPQIDLRALDPRTLLRAFSPADAVRNVRREVVEHAHIVAQVDALARRLPGCRSGRPETDAMEADAQAS